MSAGKSVKARTTYDGLHHDIEELRGALKTLAEAADWYRRCLEDVVDRRPVRGLDEARTAYDRAYEAARALDEKE